MSAATQTKQGGGIGPGVVAALVVVAGVGGFFLSRAHKGGGDKAQEVSAVPAGAVDASVERFKVPVGNAPIKGPVTAKVTIIEWSDFQCPFCSRVGPTMDQIQKAYPKDVRIAFKHNPLPFHPNATPSAQAAVAAGAQGKFWEMHDRLFKNQQAQSRDDFDKYAKEIGLNMDKFKADYDSAATKDRVQQEVQDAAKFGARGTPSFFINGRPFSGAQPFDNFKKVIDEEIVAADKAIKAGVAPAAIYDALTKAGKTSAGPDPQAQQRPTPPAADTTVYKVPLGNSPQKGPKDALVTIVIVSDFQCPFCSRVETTLTEVEKNYGDKVRFVWKNNPLPFHNNALPAAEAAMAANEQGKFWEMHDTLFKNQGALERASLEKYAGDLGLNMAKFKAVLDTDKYKKDIEADQALSAQLGARGTPSFFINGKNLRGAQPYDSFKKAIDTGIADAEAVMKAKGVNKAGVYEAIIKDGKEKADQPAPAKQPPPQAQDTSVYKALIGDAPLKGAKNAKVTIVEWSDFQCPFCSRVEPTVDQVMKAYPNDVRVAFKQLPLPFHNNAHGAAEAALAAKEQGKFWEMHAILFKNQQTLDKDSLAKYAGEIGLNVEKFKAALESGKYKAKVDQEQAEGNKIGARGTPSFFINGKSFVGAQPFDAFKAKIDEEIKNADAFMAQKHVKVEKLYDELMKDAKEGQAPPPAQAAAEPEDKTVYKVDGGNGPSKGPAGAAVQIVEFSDFQCPFCSRVVPTVHQIMEKYGSKVRITWRNYPLPFHQNAQPAAEASMAAAAQGKFWEMHDKLFANQQTLDRAHFEQFAQEIGLDVARFKKDLDANTYKAAVAADVTYANALPGGGMGTPTFFINGHKLAGAYPFDAFAKIIDEELKKK